MSVPETISIDGVKYVKEVLTPEAGAVTPLAPTKDGKPYVLVRGDRSGVFVGYLAERNGREVTLLEARRVWYWDGAATISQLATEGTKAPQNCKWPAALPKGVILDAIEVLDVTAQALLTFAEVKPWKK